MQRQNRNNIKTAVAMCGYEWIYHSRTKLVSLEYNRESWSSHIWIYVCIFVWYSFCAIYWNGKMNYLKAYMEKNSRCLEIDTKRMCSTNIETVLNNWQMLFVISIYPILSLEMWLEWMMAFKYGWDIDTICRICSKLKQYMNVASAIFVYKN